MLTQKDFRWIAKRKGWKAIIDHAVIWFPAGKRYFILMFAEYPAFKTKVIAKRYDKFMESLGE